MSILQSIPRQYIVILVLCVILASYFVINKHYNGKKSPSGKFVVFPEISPQIEDESSELKGEEFSMGVHRLEPVEPYIVKSNWKVINSREECILYCDREQKSIYSIYQVELKRCLCDNLFTTHGVVSSGSNSQQTGEVVMNAHRLSSTYYQVKKLGGPLCKCASSECSRIICEIDKLKCWAGPDLPQLKQRSIDCNEQSFKISHFSQSLIKSETKIWCLNSIKGFLPVQPCYGEWSNIEPNIYNIQPPNQITEVEIPAVRPSEKPGNKVLILAQMRTGSTLTAQLFEGNPEYFYLFEPLRKAFTNGESQLSHIMHRVWSDLYSCQLYSTSRAGLNINDQDKLRSTYRDCNRKSQLTRFSCIQYLTSSCLSHNNIAYKTIHSDVNDVKHVLETTVPDLKTIILIRDPRGAIISQSQVKRGVINDQHIQDFCDNIVESILVGRELIKKYPHQVKIVRYEDLAENIINGSAEIYQSLDLGPLPAAVINKLKSLNDSTRKPVKAFNVYRPDNHAAAYSWKKSKNYRLVVKVDSLCDLALTIAGYLPISSAQMLTDPNNFHIKSNFDLS